MNTSLIQSRTLGLNFGSDGTASVLVWAPHARKVSLETKGKPTLPLQKMQYGYWQAVAEHILPGDRYGIRINGKELLPDPASLSQPDGVHKPSEVVDLRAIRKIRCEDWKGADDTSLIIYELHVGTFSPEGTFAGVEKKLSYLQQLGVNAIEIMPVAAFPGMRNWGYDGVYPYAVQHSYGGPEAFARLVKRCHEHGIAVILDVVYNHLGPEGNYLGHYGPYFTAKYNTPWGKALNFDDSWCDGVRRYFLENALMWLRDFHVDGLRLDAVHAMQDVSPRHILQELSLAVQQLNRTSGARHFLIGESDLNDTKFIAPTCKSGYGLDMQWTDDWHHSLHALLTGEKNGYYSDFGSLQHLCKSYNHAFVYNGSYSLHRKRVYGTPTIGEPGHKFVIYAQNHDQVGNRLWGDRLSAQLGFESLKLAAAAMFFSPFVPMLFMGEEYGEQAPFLFFVDHGDPQLLEQVRKGRRREYRDFMKGGMPPDPALEETFHASKLRWNFSGDKQQQTMLAFYTACIALRKKHKLLQRERDNFLAREAVPEKTLVLIHKSYDAWLLAVLNFSASDEETLIPELAGKRINLLMYSAHRKWGGIVDDNFVPLHTDTTGLWVKSAAHSAVVATYTTG